MRGKKRMMVILVTAALAVTSVSAYFVTSKSAANPVLLAGKALGGPISGTVVIRRDKSATTNLNGEREDFQVQAENGRLVFSAHGKPRKIGRLEAGNFYLAYEMNPKEELAFEITEQAPDFGSAIATASSRRKPSLVRIAIPPQSLAKFATFVINGGFENLQTKVTDQFEQEFGTKKLFTVLDSGRWTRQGQVQVEGLESYERAYALYNPEAPIGSKERVAILVLVPNQRYENQWAVDNIFFLEHPSQFLVRALRDPSVLDSVSRRFVDSNRFEGSFINKEVKGFWVCATTCYPKTGGNNQVKFHLSIRDNHWVVSRIEQG